MTYINADIKHEAAYRLINQLQSFQIGPKPRADSAKTSDFKTAIRKTFETAAYNKSHLQEKYPNITFERNSNIAIKKPADSAIDNHKNQVTFYA